jgi:hypothetical protein
VHGASIGGGDSQSHGGGDIDYRGGSAAAEAISTADDAPWAGVMTGYSPSLAAPAPDFSAAASDHGPGVRINITGGGGGGGGGGGSVASLGAPVVSILESVHFD